MSKQKSRLVHWIRILFVLAAIWGVVAGLLIAFVPFGMSATVEVTPAGSGEVITTPVSFYESQGWWGIFILFVFAALYYGPLHFYRRGSRGMAALFAVAAILLTFLAGFSIGPFYLAGALALLIALVLLTFTREKR